MKSSRKDVEKFLLKTSTEILVALLPGPLPATQLARHVGISPQHLSRLLPSLENMELIVSWRPGTRRINRLTSKGRCIAEAVLEIRRFLAGQLSDRDVHKHRLWGMS